MEALADLAVVVQVLTKKVLNLIDRSLEEAAFSLCLVKLLVGFFSDLVRMLLTQMRDLFSLLFGPMAKILGGILGSLGEAGGDVLCIVLHVLGGVFRLRRKVLGLYLSDLKGVFCLFGGCLCSVLCTFGNRHINSCDASYYRPIASIECVRTLVDTHHRTVEFLTCKVRQKSAGPGVRTCPTYRLFKFNTRDIGFGV